MGFQVLLFPTLSNFDFITLPIPAFSSPTLEARKPCTKLWTWGIISQRTCTKPENHFTPVFKKSKMKGGWKYCWQDAAVSVSGRNRSHSQTFLKWPGRWGEERFCLLPNEQMLALLMQSKVQRMSKWNTSGTQWQRLCIHFQERNSLQPWRGQRGWCAVASLSLCWAYPLTSIPITADDSFNSVSG